MHGWWLSDVIPLVAGAAGSSLAEDQRRGHTLTVLARGVSRGRYLLAKVLGAAASGAVITLAVIGGFYVMVAILWPAGSATWHGDGPGPAPMPALHREAHPTHDLLVASISVVASAVLPLAGVLAGVLAINEYLAMAAPSLFVILGAVVLGNVFAPLSPYVYLSLQGAYAWRDPERLLPYAPFLYWLSFSALTAVLCRWIFAKKELA
jgi:hypothetical protein